MTGGYFFVARLIHVLRGYDDAGGLCLIGLSDKPSVASGYSSRPVHFDEVLSVGEHLSDNTSL